MIAVASPSIHSWQNVTRPSLWIPIENSLMIDSGDTLWWTLPSSCLAKRSTSRAGSIISTPSLRAAILTLDKLAESPLLLASLYFCIFFPFNYYVVSAFSSQTYSSCYVYVCLFLVLLLALFPSFFPFIFVPSVCLVHLSLPFFFSSYAHLVFSVSPFLLS